MAVDWNLNMLQSILSIFCYSTATILFRSGAEPIEAKKKHRHVPPSSPHPKRVVRVKRRIYANFFYVYFIIIYVSSTEISTSNNY